MNCMAKAAELFLGFTPPQNADGTVHEERIIDLAIAKGMHPCRINFFPVSVNAAGKKIATYSLEHAEERMGQFIPDYPGILIGTINGVPHAEYTSPNYPANDKFDSLQYGIFDLMGDINDH